MPKHMSASNDYVFKLLFGEEENKQLLLSLLNAIFNSTQKTLIDITLIDPHIKKEHKTDKMSILDIRAVTTSGEQINVEVQVEDEGNIEKRSLYYWAKLYENQMKSGGDYGEDLKKAITICILDFKLPYTEEFHSVFGLYERIHHFKLIDDLEMHFIELPKFTTKTKTENKLLSDWIQFLKIRDERRLKELAMNIQNPTIEKAIELLERINQDPAARMMYELREKQKIDQRSAVSYAKSQGEQIGLEKGEQIGLEKGERKKAIEIATDMLLLNALNLEDISKITKLSIKEIEELKSTM